MTDQELADKIVAFGIGSPMNDEAVFFPDDNHWIGKVKFVRDWGVVGALMEKCTEVSWVQHKEKDFTVAARLDTNSCYINGDSLPHAIIEACAEALTND